MFQSEPASLKAVILEKKGGLNYICFKLTADDNANGITHHESICF